MNTFNWILFDADHTLFDFDKASEEALSEVLRCHGLEWCEGMYGDYKKINIQCWQEHEQGLMDRDTLIYERFRRYFNFLAVELDPVRTHDEYLERLGLKPYLIPGAAEILRYLKKYSQIGYITNGISHVQRTRLSKIGWESLFDAIFIAGEIGYSKPHPGYFQTVHEGIRSPDKSSVLVVGDSLTADIAGAAGFGYSTCWFNPEGQSCYLDMKPDFMISHLEQLKSICQVPSGQAE